MLIAFAGLPGVGKTTIARELARRMGAVFVRIDSIEFALRQSGRIAGAMEDAGYRVAYALAEDNLSAGLSVVADSVNPIQLTRNAWRSVARRTGARFVEVEVVCTDTAEHRRRVETRPVEFPGWTLTWQEVAEREYEPWNGLRIILDTAQITPDRHVEHLLAQIHR